MYRPNVNTGTNPSLLDYCEQNDILPVYRSNVGEMSFTFNRQTGLLEQEHHNTDETKAVNSGRVGTMLRAASESTHTLKQIYPFLGRRVHNSRLNVVGRQTINTYNTKFNKNFSHEWAETAKINIEYLVGAGLFNRWSPLFQR